jgi:hypothetical protein
MVEMPGVKPLTRPPVPADATVVLLLVHVPPEGVADKVVVVPTQIWPELPVIAVGAGLTVTTTGE